MRETTFADDVIIIKKWIEYNFIVKNVASTLQISVHRVYRARSRLLNGTLRGLGLDSRAVPVDRGRICVGCPLAVKSVPNVTLGPRRR